MRPILDTEVAVLPDCCCCYGREGWQMQLVPLMERLANDGACNWRPTRHTIGLNRTERPVKLAARAVASPCNWDCRADTNAAAVPWCWEFDEPTGNSASLNYPRPWNNSGRTCRWKLERPMWHSYGDGRNWLHTNWRFRHLHCPMLHRGGSTSSSPLCRPAWHRSECLLRSHPGTFWVDEVHFLLESLNKIKSNLSHDFLMQWALCQVRRVLLNYKFQIRFQQLSVYSG